MDKAYSNVPFNFQIFYVLVLTKNLDLDWNITGIKNFYSSKKKLVIRLSLVTLHFLKLYLNLEMGGEYKKLSKNTRKYLKIFCMLILLLV